MAEVRVVLKDFRQGLMRMDECVGLLLLSRILLSAQRVFVLSPCPPVVEKHTTLIRLLFVGSTITGITLHSDTPAEHQLLHRLQFRRVVDATDSLRRLQRRFIRRRSDRRLALCMALHPRLGGASPLAALDQDLVRLCNAAK
jgi:hypothetical protein